MRPNNSKSDAAARAMAHHKEMELKYKVQSMQSLNETEWLRSNNLMIVDLPYSIHCNTVADMQVDTVFLAPLRGRFNTHISVVNQTSTDAVMSAKGIPTVLNFASYKYPGGGYIKGAKAQEECLCLDSNLYNILVNLQPIYAMQSMSMQGGVYYTSVFYTPNVIFKSSKLANVITCAAPNRGTALMSGYTDDYINAVMTERIYSILYMAAKHSDCKTLILGAFGCGVFMNVPETVAKIFKEVINTYFQGVFEHIVFAIVEGPSGDKVKTFSRVFQEK